MPFPIIPLLVAAGSAAFQYAQGEKQKKMARNIKPSNYVPPAVQEAETMAKMSQSSLPVGYTRGLERINQNTATTIESAKRVGGSSGQIQQAVADADARSKEVSKDLAVAAGAENQANRRDLYNILSTKGQFEKASNDAYNAAVSALTGASMQNKYNAISGLAENVILAASDIKGPYGYQTSSSGQQQPATSTASPGLVNQALSPAQQEFLRRSGYNFGRYGFNSGYNPQ